MDTLRNPAGPLPPRVYWRRRLMLLAVVLLAVALVAWACSHTTGAQQQQPMGVVTTPTDLPTVPSDPTSPTPSPTPGLGMQSSGTGTSAHSGSPTGHTKQAGHTRPASPSASPSVSRRDGKPLCPTADLRVSVRTDHKFYAEKAKPRFTLLVVNISRSRCWVDLGSASSSLFVISGRDRIWTSTDCGKVAEEHLRKLPSGGVYTSSVTWDRLRSWSGCPDRTVAAKPGYYVLDARIGKAKPRDRAVFVLQ